jgi:hypothetical protein
MSARSWWLAGAGVLLVLLGVGGSPSPAVGGERARASRVPGEIVVGFEHSASEAARGQVVARVGATEKQKNKLKKIDAKVLKVPPARVDAVLKRLHDDPRVRYAEPNYVVSASVVPNDPSFSQLWGMHNTGQVVNGTPGTPDADIDAPEAWNIVR